MGNTRDKYITKIGNTNDRDITKISCRQVAPIRDVNYYKKQSDMVGQPDVSGSMSGSMSGFVEQWDNNMCKCDNKANVGEYCKECHELYEKRKYIKKCF